jgi:hypothetical protein
MSNLVKHAEKELDLIGLTENSKDEMNVMMRKHILHMVKEFAAEGHSGFSAPYAIDALSKLFSYKPLAPLTGEDSEWNEILTTADGPRWQNNRRSSVFKDADGSCWDIDGKVFWEWWKDNQGGHPDPQDGHVTKVYYTCFESRVPVTFPYIAPDKPIYEYRFSGGMQDDAQTEEGFI